MCLAHRLSSGPYPSFLSRREGCHAASRSSAYRAKLILANRPTARIDRPRNRGCPGPAVPDLARRLVAARPELDCFYVVGQSCHRPSSPSTRGCWSQVRPSSTWPAESGVGPPHCFQKNATPAVRHASRRCRAQSIRSARGCHPFMVRALPASGMAMPRRVRRARWWRCGPLSPPAMTWLMPERSRVVPRSARSGSALMNLGPVARALRSRSNAREVDW